MKPVRADIESKSVITETSRQSAYFALTLNYNRSQTLPCKLQGERKSGHTCAHNDNSFVRAESHGRGIPWRSFAGRYNSTIGCRSELWAPLPITNTYSGV